MDQRLTARPFNRYDPMYTMWWLVASTEWPAYRFAKIFFDQRRDCRFICFGIHLETGWPLGCVRLSQSEELDHARRLGMAQVQLRREAGVVDRSVRVAAAASGEPLSVIVDASYLQDPGSFDPYATRKDRSATTDTIQFASRAGELAMTSTRFGVIVLSQPTRATNPADFGRKSRDCHSFRSMERSIN